ncbi:MAG: HEAT repeat domain-containing protein [Planctomycetia bacterium]
MRLTPRFVRVLAALLALAPFVGAMRPADAICPSKFKRPGGSVPPGVRAPFDPSAPPATDEPEDPPPSTTTPGETRPPPTTPKPVTPTAPPAPTITGPDTTGPDRERRGRGLEALDEISWELWWGLNRADVLPRVKRQDDSPDGPYARTLPPELRPVIDVLLAAIDDPDGGIRQTAASAFAGYAVDYRRTDVINALRRHAKGSDHWVRDLCHLGLGLRKDMESVPGMRQVLRSKQDISVSRAFAALGLLMSGDKESLAEVAEAAEDLEDTEMAGAILLAMGQSRDLQHLPRITKMATRKAGGPAQRMRRVRSDAIIALGKMGDPTSVAVLADLLDDREKVISRSAALALGGFKGHEGALEVLRTKGLASDDEFVRAYAAISMGRIGSTAQVPVLARFMDEEKSVAVRPFAVLALGLLRDITSSMVLGNVLEEMPRGGRFGAGAIATGLVKGGDDLRGKLRGALRDTKSTSAPACSALGLGLLSDKDTLPHLRERFWFDSTRVRPGFADGLALISPAEQATWLVEEYRNARRSSQRQALADALSMCGGPSEAAALADFYKAAPAGDGALRVGLLTAMTVIANDRQVSRPRSLLLHTYYLQPNDVLGHIAYLP